MPVARKEKIDSVRHGPNQRPAQKAHPAAAPDKPPCHHCDIKPIQQATIGKLPMQDAVSMQTIDMGKAFDEIGSVDILQIETLLPVEALKMLHFAQTKRAESVVVDAQGDRFWCVHACETPLMVQGSQAFTSQRRRRI